MDAWKRRSLFFSHTVHEISMYYPMRAIRKKRYKLIHNLNYFSPFPIDQDFYLSPTFRDLLNRTRSRLPTNWYKNLTDYYYRREWEFYDLKKDPRELRNRYSSVKYKRIVTKLKKELFNWQNTTADPFICSPHFVLEDAGLYKTDPTCLPLFN